MGNTGDTQAAYFRAPPLKRGLLKFLAVYLSITMLVALYTVGLDIALRSRSI